MGKEGFLQTHNMTKLLAMAYPGVFFGGGVSTNSVEKRGQREWGLGAVAP
jgi:hypothetical protein